MLPDASVAPQLPWSVDARVLFALRDLLRGDVDLVDALAAAGGIEIYEMSALLEDSTVAAPCLGIVPMAVEERLVASSYTGSAMVGIGVLIITQAPATPTDTQDLLRQRLAERVRDLVRQNHGVLMEGGTRLTKAVTAIDRVDLSQRRLPSRGLATLLVLRYETDLDLETREILE